MGGTAQPPACIIGFIIFGIFIIAIGPIGGIVIPLGMFIGMGMLGGMLVGIMAFC